MLAINTEVKTNYHQFLLMINSVFFLEKVLTLG